MTSTYECPNWHLSACGWWFKRLFNSRDETALHMDVFDKLLAPRKHNGTKDSMFVCDDELGKQYTMAVVRKGGLADNRRQALLQLADFRAWLNDSGSQPGDYIAFKRQDERVLVRRIKAADVKPVELPPWPAAGNPPAAAAAATAAGAPAAAVAADAAAAAPAAAAAAADAAAGAPSAGAVFVEAAAAAPSAAAAAPAAVEAPSAVAAADAAAAALAAAPGLAAVVPLIASIAVKTEPAESLQPFLLLQPPLQPTQQPAAQLAELEATPAAELTRAAIEAWLRTKLAQSSAHLDDLCRSAAELVAWGQRGAAGAAAEPAALAEEQGPMDHADGSFSLAAAGAAAVATQAQQQQQQASVSAPSPSPSPSPSRSRKRKLPEPEGQPEPLPADAHADSASDADVDAAPAAAVAVHTAPAKPAAPSLLACCPAAPGAQHAAIGAGSLQEQLAALAAERRHGFLEQAQAALQAAAVQADAGGMLRALKLLVLAGHGGCVLQDIIQRWAALPLSVQAALFDAALITAAEGSWALLEQQLQLVLDVAGA